MPIKPRDPDHNAGNFLCGFFCCQGVEIPEEMPQSPDGGGQTPRSTGGG